MSDERGAVTVRAKGLRRGLLLGLVLPLVVSACTVGPSASPDVLTEQEPPGAGRDEMEPEEAPLPPIGEQGAESINWTPCAGQVRSRIGEQARDDDSLKFSCGTVISALDAPQLPGHGMLQLSVLKAGKQDEGTVPLVVVNDIGGEPGTVFAAKLAAELPDEVLEKYSIVGFDRRGTGQSEPIDCVPQATREGLLDTDFADEDLAPLLEAVRKAGQECALTLGNEQRAYDTQRTAGDLEEIRKQLGMPVLHAIGRGEGSRVLTTYADQHTGRLGRVVLDGHPDPAHQVENMLEDVAAGAEATLDEFAAECAGGDCPLGDDARGSVTKLLDRLRDRPRTTGDGLEVGPSLALSAIWTGLRDPGRWSELAKAIDSALDGKPDRLAGFAEPALTGVPGYRPSLDGTLTTTCNDTTNRLSPGRISELSDQWRDRHPVFGGIVAQRLAWCSQWPAGGERLPEPDTKGTPPMLVVSTAADPVTPREGTTRAADQMHSARTLSWLGAGHGALGRSDCATDKVAAFLVEGKVPGGGISCPP